MKRKSNMPKTHLVIYLITMIFLLVFLPMTCIKIYPRFIENSNVPENSVKIPEKISLYLNEEKKTITLDFEDYVAGVVASEMPESFHIEALKAQAVVSRTYALGKINSGATLCDSTHCQVYTSKDIPSKVKKAVKSTKGLLLYYDEKLAASALYFASSGGRTENAEDVFENKVPYLKSVSSPYEKKATHQNEQATLSLLEFENLLKDAFPKLAFGKITKSNIKVLSRTKGDRVKLVQIGSATLTGSQLRTALNLYSSNASISVKKNKITITTKGSGHGVGMSQYGADGFAEKGYTYEKILSHYYNGASPH